MELHTVREARRGAQAGRIMDKKTGTADAPAKAPKGPVDKLTLSRQAAAFVEEQSRKMWDEVREREQRRKSRMDSAAQPAGGELDLLSKGLRVLELCRKIAASIMKGNKVPPEDLEFLMKNDPDGYRLAMAMRRENPDPEEEESVLTDEDKNGGGGESPAVDASGAGGSGGVGESPAVCP